MDWLIDLLTDTLIGVPAREATVPVESHVIEKRKSIPPGCSWYSSTEENAKSKISFVLDLAGSGMVSSWTLEDAEVEANKVLVGASAAAAAATFPSSLKYPVNPLPAILIHAGLYRMWKIKSRHYLSRFLGQFFRVGKKNRKALCDRLKSKEFAYRIAFNAGI